MEVQGGRRFRRGAGGGGMLVVVHGRSGKTTRRPTPPCNTATENVGFSPTRQTWRASSSKRHEGVGTWQGG